MVDESKKPNSAGRGKYSKIISGLYDTIRYLDKFFGEEIAKRDAEISELRFRLAAAPAAGCVTCKGTGKLLVDPYDLTHEKCRDCNGTGKAKAAPAASGGVRAGFKPIYVKRWRTLILVPESLADEMRDAFAALTAPPLPADITHIKIEHPHRPYETDNEYADMLRRIRDFGGDRTVPGILQMYALGNPIQGSFAGSLWAIAEWVSERLPFLSAPLPADGVRPPGWAGNNPDMPEGGHLYVDPPLDWAISRWRAEVKNRPLQNVHRRALDTTWRQVIRYFCGNDRELCGPPHDELVDALASPHEQGEG